MEKDSMSIQGLPNELIIIIGTHLEACSLYHLILVNRRFFTLLLPRLRDLVLQLENAEVALHWAMLSGNQDLARHILEKGGQMDGGPSNRVPAIPEIWTPDWIIDEQDKALDEISFPVYCAVHRANNTLLRLALSAGMMDIQSCMETVSHALCIGNMGALEIFLEWAALSLTESVYKEFLESVFVLVTSIGDVAAIRLLLARGVDVNMRCPRGESSVLFCASQGSLCFLKVLLEHGVDINIRDSEGRSPLDLVMSRSDCGSEEVEEVVELLRMADLRIDR